MKLNFLIIVVWSCLVWTTNGFAQLSRSGDFPVRIDSLASKNDTVKISVKSPTGAMIRSLIFPGWGQLYNKKYFKSLLAFGAEIGLIANSIYLNQKYKDWDQKYKESEPGLEQTINFKNREFYINNRNLSNWYLLGVILFSMADAFVDAHLSDFDESPDLSLIKIIPICRGDDIGIQLSVCVNFNCP